MNLESKSVRRDLIAKLGGQCVRCGSTKRLQFDHIKPRRWEPEAISKSKRMRGYLRAAEQGKLQLLCDSCHAVKTGKENHPVPWLKGFLEYLAEPEPF